MSNMIELCAGISYANKAVLSFRTPRAVPSILCHLPTDAVSVCIFAAELGALPAMMPHVLLTVLMHFCSIGRGRQTACLWEMATGLPQPMSSRRMSVRMHQVKWTRPSRGVRRRLARRRRTARAPPTSTLCTLPRGLLRAGVQVEVVVRSAWRGRNRGGRRLRKVSGSISIVTMCPIFRTWRIKENPTMAATVKAATYGCLRRETR
jgi:hypothetical protein